jgi:rhamnose utilization protein RhaD (predicted bifunctional aldolase and dehydrogenase)
MVSNSPDTGLDAAAAPIEELIEISRFFGSDTRYVIAGGGNTSCKTADRLFVKGSGSSLAAIDAGGFVEMAREPLAALTSRDLGSDPSEREARFKDAILAARIHPQKGQRPSVECVLHNMLPRKFVVHTHATDVNTVACCRDGERLAAQIFGDRILWIHYVDPGYTLARTLAGAIEAYASRTGMDCPPAVLMQNHGLIVCGNSFAEIREQTNWILARIEAHAEKLPSIYPFGRAG